MPTNENTNPTRKSGEPEVLGVMRVTCTVEVDIGPYSARTTFADLHEIAERDAVLKLQAVLSKERDVRYGKVQSIEALVLRGKR